MLAAQITQVRNLGLSTMSFTFPQQTSSYGESLTQLTADLAARWDALPKNQKTQVRQGLQFFLDLVQSKGPSTWQQAQDYYEAASKRVNWTWGQAECFGKRLRQETQDWVVTEATDWWEAKVDFFQSLPSRLQASVFNFYQPLEQSYAKEGVLGLGAWVLKAYKHHLQEDIADLTVVKNGRSLLGLGLALWEGYQVGKLGEQVYYLAMQVALDPERFEQNPVSLLKDIFTGNQITTELERVQASLANVEALARPEEGLGLDQIMTNEMAWSRGLFYGREVVMYAFLRGARTLFSGFARRLMASTTFSQGLFNLSEEVFFASNLVLGVELRARAQGKKGGLHWAKSQDRHELYKKLTLGYVRRFAGRFLFQILPTLGSTDKPDKMKVVQLSDKQPRPAAVGTGRQALVAAQEEGIGQALAPSTLDDGLSVQSPGPLPVLVPSHGFLDPPNPILTGQSLVLPSADHQVYRLDPKLAGLGDQDPKIFKAEHIQDGFVVFYNLEGKAIRIPIKDLEEGYPGLQAADVIGRRFVAKSLSASGGHDGYGPSIRPLLNPSQALATSPEGQSFVLGLEMGDFPEGATTYRVVISRVEGGQIALTLQDPIMGGTIQLKLSSKEANNLGLLNKQGGPRLEESSLVVMEAADFKKTATTRAHPKVPVGFSPETRDPVFLTRQVANSDDLQAAVRVVDISRTVVFNNDTTQSTYLLIFAESRASKAPSSLRLNESQWALLGLDEDFRGLLYMVMEKLPSPHAN